MIFKLHNLETYLGLEQDFSWQSFVQFTLHGLFLVVSLANISLISLERLHATLFPFRHCLVGTRVYLTIILCSWLFSLILSSVVVLLYLHASPASFYVCASYPVVIILIRTVSYAIIISTVKNNPPSPNAGPVLSTERKLTVTLFVVTLVSFLTILPGLSLIVVPPPPPPPPIYGVRYALQYFSTSPDFFMRFIFLILWSIPSYMQ